jgi:hypothetical protein
MRRERRKLRHGELVCILLLVVCVAILAVIPEYALIYGYRESAQLLVVPVTVVSIIVRSAAPASKCQS